MQVNIAPGELRDLLSRVLPAIPRHSEENALLQAKDGCLAATAESMNVTVMARTRAETPAEGGICAPLRALAGLADKFQARDGMATLRSIAADDPANNEPPALFVKCGRNRARLAGAPAQEYPTPPELADDAARLVFETADFVRAVDGVIHAVLDDHLRPALAGALLERPPERPWRLVASNGYRLAIAELTAVSDRGADAETKAILPAKALRIVANAVREQSGTVTLECDAERGAARFTTRDLTVVGPLVAEQFPEYRRLEPDAYQARVLASREDLLQALDFCNIFARDQGYHCLVLLETHGDELRLRTWRDRKHVGKARAAFVPLSITGHTRFALRHNFLKDAVRAAGSEFIAIETTDPKSQAALRDVDGKRVEVVMPAMIQWD